MKKNNLLENGGEDAKDKQQDPSTSKTEQLKSFFQKLPYFKLLFLGLIVYLIYQYNQPAGNVLSDWRERHFGTIGIGKTKLNIHTFDDLEQMVFLTYQKQFAIDTINQSRQLVLIYEGKVNIGIDLSERSPEWFSYKEKEVVVKLPKLKVLNKGNNYIDDLKTYCFIEQGTWSNEVMPYLVKKANRQMEKYLTEGECLKRAEQNAKKMITSMLNQEGFDNINITFAE